MTLKREIQYSSGFGRFGRPIGVVAAIGAIDATDAIDGIGAIRVIGATDAIGVHRPEPCHSALPGTPQEPIWRFRKGQSAQKGKFNVLRHPGRLRRETG